MERDSATAKKKAPGRPRKKPEIEKPQIRGVLEAAENSDNHVEFVSQHPAIYKRLAAYFRAVGVSEIAIVFRKTEVEIQTIDHFGNVHICVRFDCSKTIAYYCESPITIYTTRLSYEREFHQLDNSIPYVSFYLNKTSMRQEIQIQTFMSSLGAIKTTPLKLIVGPSDGRLTRPNLSNNEFDNYSLRFQMETKALKKQLCQWERKKVFFCFRKIGERPLCITPLLNNVELAAITFKNTEQIKEISSVTPDDVLDIVLPANTIQPIISTPFAEMVSFYLDFEREMIVQFLHEVEGCSVTFRINFHNRSEEAD